MSEARTISEERLAEMLRVHIKTPRRIWKLDLFIGTNETPHGATAYYCELDAVDAFLEGSALNFGGTWPRPPADKLLAEKSLLTPAEAGRVFSISAWAVMNVSMRAPCRPSGSPPKPTASRPSYS